MPGLVLMTHACESPLIPGSEAAGNTERPQACRHVSVCVHAQVKQSGCLQTAGGQRRQPRGRQEDKGRADLSEWEKQSSF